MNQVRRFGMRAPRIDIWQPAILTNSDGDESSTIILDISALGFSLKLSDEVRKGEIVRLRGSTFEDVQGQICWVTGSRAGGIFLTPVDAASLIE